MAYYGGEAGTAGYGGYLVPLETLSDGLREQASLEMRSQQFVRLDPQSKLNVGDTYSFNRLYEAEDEADTVAEGSVYPRSRVPITKGTVVVGKQGLIIPYTGELQQFSKWDPSNPYQARLKNAIVRAIERSIITQFRATKIKYVPQGTTTPTSQWYYDGTVGVAATRDIEYYDLCAVVDAMAAELAIPEWPGGGYNCLASRAFTRAIRNDPDNRWFTPAAQSEAGRIWRGEIGDVENCRFTETHYYISQVLGTTAYAGEAFIFGPDAVIEVLSRPIRVALEPEREQGDLKEIGISWIGAHSITWEDTDTTAAGVAGKCRVVHVTST